MTEHLSLQAALPELDNPLSDKVRTFTAYIQSERTCYPNLFVIRWVMNSASWKTKDLYAFKYIKQDQITDIK